MKPYLDKSSLVFIPTWLSALWAPSNPVWIRSRLIIHLSNTPYTKPFIVISKLLIMTMYFLSFYDDITGRVIISCLPGSGQLPISFGFGDRYFCYCTSTILQSDVNISPIRFQISPSNWISRRYVKTYFTGHGDGEVFYFWVWNNGNLCWIIKENIGVYCQRTYRFFSVTSKITWNNQISLCSWHSFRFLFFFCVLSHTWWLVTTNHVNAAAITKQT